MTAPFNGIPPGKYLPETDSGLLHDEPGDMDFLHYYQQQSTSNHKIAII